MPHSLSSIALVALAVIACTSPADTPAPPLANSPATPTASPQPVDATAPAVQPTAPAVPSPTVPPPTVPAPVTRIDFYATEAPGGIRTGTSAAEVERVLGRAQRSRSIRDGRKTEQAWSYPDLGLKLHMHSTSAKSGQEVKGATITAPSTWTTTAGIGIGATRADVLAAYRGQASDIPAEDYGDAFIAGVEDRGLLFEFVDDRVAHIYLGTFVD